MEWSITDDFEKETLLKEDSLREWARRLSGWLGTVPPASRDEAGMECIKQRIRLGPRVPKTFSSYEMFAMLYVLQGCFAVPLLENLRLVFPDCESLVALYGVWVSYITNFVPRKFDLNFPMFVLVDLDKLLAFIDITYSVHVARQFLFADRRNLPLSTSTAEPRERYK